MKPAAKHTDPVVGMDQHLVQPPGGVPPILMPIPVVGMVMDPSDYAPGACTVLIHGLPRARAGTKVMMCPPHVPIGGAFVKPPLSEAEMYEGSSTVIVDGDAASAMGHRVLGCHDLGAPAPVRAWKVSPARSLMKPGSSVLPIPAGAQVVVGGPPVVCARPPASDAPATRPAEWISVEVVDDEGAPFVGAWLALELPDGSTRRSIVPEDGWVDHALVPAGTCKVVGYARPPRSSTPRAHVAGRDEWLGSIAQDHGIGAWESVWDAAENDALREQRSDPHVLAPGDVVHLPGPTPAELATGQPHRLTLVRPKNRIRLRFVELGVALADLDVVLRVSRAEAGTDDDAEVHAPTDGDGWIDLELPYEIRRVQVAVERLGFETTVHLGAADPTADGAAPRHDGIAQRLEVLGYGRFDRRNGSEADEQDRFLVATAWFQERALSATAPSGELDDETLRALEEASAGP